MQLSSKHLCRSISCQLTPRTLCHVRQLSGWERDGGGHGPGHFQAKCCIHDLFLQETATLFSVQEWPWPAMHVCMCVLSRVRLFVTPPWTVAYQPPLSVGFSRKNTGVGCCLLLQGGLSGTGMEPCCISCTGRWSLPLSHEHVLNFTVYSNQLCILLTCRF